MKTAIASTLATFLDDLCTAGLGGSYAIIDLYTIILRSGVTLRWAAWAIPITFPSSGIYGGGSVGGNTRVSGHTFLASQAYIDRSKLIQALKLEVSQIKITLRASPLMVIGATPVLAAINDGLFGGAAVWVDRLWTPTIRPMDFSLGTMNWFTGNIAEVDKCGRSSATLTAKDPTAYFSTAWPRDLYLAGCVNTFGDAKCTFDKSTVTTTGIVQSGSTTALIKTNLSQPGGLASPSAPSLNETGHQNDVNLASQTYFVVVTFTGADGESSPSGESSFAITGSSNPGANGTTDKLLIVQAPTSPPAAATGWNVYVGLASGQEQLQATFTGFGADWTQIGALAQGAPPPLLGTAGYYSQGVITLTSGANAGLVAFVSDYQFVSGAGQVTVSPPLPTAPLAGDTFSITPDCDKTQARCTAYNNIAHFNAFPYIPLPEQSV